MPFSNPWADGISTTFRATCAGNTCQPQSSEVSVQKLASCTATPLTCDFYIQATNGTGQETTRLTRITTGGNTYHPLTLKVLTLDGTALPTGLTYSWTVPNSTTPLTTAQIPAAHVGEYKVTITPPSGVGPSQGGGLGVCELYISLSGTPCSDITAAACSCTPDATDPSKIICNPAPRVMPSTTELLSALAPGDQITANDFIITVTSVTATPLSTGAGGVPQGQGVRFSGEGYVTPKLLGGTPTGVAVEFTDIQLNTCYQFIQGTIKTKYDPSWSGILDVEQTIEAITDLIDDIQGKSNKVQDALAFIQEELKKTNPNRAAIAQKLAEIEADFIALSNMDIACINPTQRQAFQQDFANLKAWGLGSGGGSNMRLSTDDTGPGTIAARLLTDFGIEYAKCLAQTLDNTLALIRGVVKSTEFDNAQRHVQGATGATRCAALFAEGFTHELFSNVDAIGISKQLADFAKQCLTGAVRYYQNCLTVSPTANLDHAMNCILGAPCGPRLLAEATPAILSATADFVQTLFDDCATTTPTPEGDQAAYNRGRAAAFIATIIIPTKYAKLAAMAGKTFRFGGVSLKIKYPQEAINLFRQGQWQNGLKRLFGRAGFSAGRFQHIDNWVASVTNATQRALLESKIQNWSDDLLEKLDGALGSSRYTGLNAEFTANATLLDYFQQLNTNWFARYGFVRAHSLGAGSVGKINFPTHFMNYMLDLELLPGVRASSIYGTGRSSILELGIKFDTKIKGILTDAFRGGRAGIEAADIPTDLKNIYLRLWDDGYTKAIRDVRLKTANNVEFIPDLLFFKTRNGGLSFSQVIYHDAKIDVSTIFTDGQEAAITAIQTAKNNATVAQFRLANDLNFENKPYLSNTSLTLKEVSKVATQTTSGQVNLVRRIEIEQ